jgi:hypothetical protein
MIWGAILRFFYLGSQSIWIDEGFTINGSLAILKNGLPILDSGVFYSNGILNSYLVAFLIKIFQFDPFNPWILRLPSAFFGTVLILACYYLYKELFQEKRGAIVAALLITFSYWEIAWSRQIRGYMVATLCLTLSLIYLWRYISNKKVEYFFWISVFLIIIGSLFQQSILVFLPILILLRFFKHDFSISYINKKILITNILLVSIIFLYLEAYGSLINKTPIDIFFFFAPTEFYISGLILILGLIFSFFRREKIPSLYFIGYCSLFGFVFVLLFAPAMHIRYIFPIFILLIIGAVKSIGIISNYFLNSFSDRNVKISIFLIAFVIFLPYLQFFPINTYKLDWGAPQPNFKRTFEIIKTTRNSQDIIISAYPHLHKIYLNDNGYWLKMRLDEREADISKRLIDNKEYYVNAPIIENLTELKEIIKEKHGYLIVDSMSATRIPGLFKFLENSGNIKRIYEDVDKKGEDSIYLYKFI